MGVMLKYRVLYLCSEMGTERYSLPLLTTLGPYFARFQIYNITKISLWKFIK